MYKPSKPKLPPQPIWATPLAKWRIEYETKAEHWWVDIRRPEPKMDDWNAKPPLRQKLKLQEPLHAINLHYSNQSQCSTSTRSFPNNALIAQPLLPAATKRSQNTRQSIKSRENHREKVHDATTQFQNQNPWLSHSMPRKRHSRETWSKPHKPTRANAATPTSASELSSIAF